MAIKTVTGTVAKAVDKALQAAAVAAEWDFEESELVTKASEATERTKTGGTGSALAELHYAAATAYEAAAKSSKGSLDHYRAAAAHEEAGDVFAKSRALTFTWPL